MMGLLKEGRILKSRGPKNAKIAQPDAKKSPLL